MCGEKAKDKETVIDAEGSPPRVRGKDDYLLLLRDAFRITPACAGKSTAISKIPPCNRDHPRVCGEKIFWTRTPQAMRGSPPRVRGKDPGKTGNHPITGITPACAGKSPPAYMYAR